MFDKWSFYDLNLYPFGWQVDQEVDGASSEALGQTFASVDRVDSGSPASTAVSILLWGLESRLGPNSPLALLSPVLGQKPFCNRDFWWSPFSRHKNSTFCPVFRLHGQSVFSDIFLLTTQPFCQFSVLLPHEFKQNLVALTLAMTQTSTCPLLLPNFPLILGSQSTLSCWKLLYFSFL